MQRKSWEVDVLMAENVKSEVWCEQPSHPSIKDWATEKPHGHCFFYNALQTLTFYVKSESVLNLYGSSFYWRSEFIQVYFTSGIEIKESKFRLSGYFHLAEGTWLGCSSSKSLPSTKSTLLKIFQQVFKTVEMAKLAKCQTQMFLKRNISVLKFCTKRFLGRVKRGSLCKYCNISRMRYRPGISRKCVRKTLPIIY